MKKRLFAIFIIILLLGNMTAADGLPGLVYGELLRMSTRAEAATEVTIKSEKDLIKILYQTLINRDEKIVIKHTLSDYEIDLNNLLDKIYAIDDKKTAKDHDYLKYSLLRWGYSGTRIGKKTTLDFEFTYKTSLKEEQAVDKKVKSILQELELEDDTDYEKVKEIHDYIINQVSYDNTLTKASVYDALIDKSAVCEGYSMLAYRIFTEAGLKSRIIAGTGNGGSHAWNIIEIKDKWYNIDLTWDDPIASDGKPMLVYDFFLKSTKDFVNHKRSAEYKTEEFLKTYPISKTSYQME
jgi:hypothetical protein